MLKSMLFCPKQEGLLFFSGVVMAGGCAVCDDGAARICR